MTRTFAETDAAAPLRGMLATNRHVSAIVDFGAGIVFEGVGAYTVLFSATKQRNRQWQLTRVASPPTLTSLRTAERAGSALHAEMRAANLGAEPWTLSLPAEQTLLDRLASAHRNLGEVTANQIFQGLITGAEDVYRCVDAGPHPSDPTLRLVRPNAQPDAAPVALEQAALRRVVAGSNDLKRFRFEPSPQWIIFPYERDDHADPYRIVTARRMQTIWPGAFAWLDQNKTILKARSPKSAWNRENWPAYSRRQNLERFAEPKVLVPYMVKELNATVDPTGDAGYFVNVTTGGYGLQLAPDPAVSMEFLAALLSSELLSWALRRRSRAWRGDWMGARAANLRRLPILEPDAATQQAVIAAFDGCRRLAAELADAVTDHDTELLGRLLDDAVAAFDRRLFELYSITNEELQVIRSA